jgi:chromosome segregation ATPase
MQRIYIFIVIAAIVFAASYSDTIKNFFQGSRENASPVRQESAKQNDSDDSDDSYEQLRIDLYRTATTLSDLQGKIQILQMAKEKREWFRDEDYAHLDALIEETEKELEAAKSAYEKTKEDFTRTTVQMMLETYSEQQ